MSNNLEKILHGYNETEEAIIKIIEKKTNTAAESVIAENLIPYPYYSRVRGTYGGVTSDVNPDGSITLNGLCTATGVAFRIVFPDYNPIQLERCKYIFSAGIDKDKFISGNRVDLIMYRSDGSSKTISNAYNTVVIDNTSGEFDYIGYISVTVKSDTLLEDYIIRPQLEKGEVLHEFVSPELSRKNLLSKSTVKSKRIIFEGDSITQVYNVSRPYTRMLCAEIGVYDYTNTAVGGSTIAKSREDDTNAIVHRVDDINFSEYDLFVFGAGTNDWSQAIPLGTNYESSSIYEIYGAMNYILNKAYTDNPKIKVFFWTPMRRFRHGGGPIDPCTYENNGVTLKDYAKSLENYCRYKGINCINMFEEGFLNEYNKTDTDILQSDMLHPGQIGQVMLAEKLASYIKASMY